MKCSYCRQDSIQRPKLLLFQSKSFEVFFVAFAFVFLLFAFLSLLVYFQFLFLPILQIVGYIYFVFPCLLIWQGCIRIVAFSRLTITRKESWKLVVFSPQLVFHYSLKFGVTFLLGNWKAYLPTTKDCRRMPLDALGNRGIPFLPNEVNHRSPCDFSFLLFFLSVSNSYN